MSKLLISTVENTLYTKSFIQWNPLISTFYISTFLYFYAFSNSRICIFFTSDHFPSFSIRVTAGKNPPRESTHPTRERRRNQEYPGNRGNTPGIGGIPRELGKSPGNRGNPPRIGVIPRELGKFPENQGNLPKIGEIACLYSERLLLLLITAVIALNNGDSCSS